MYEDLDDRVRAIMAHLDDLPDADLADFRDRVSEAVAALAVPDLYTAAILLTGRTFDEERFAAFRTGLLLKGRRCWENAAADPDRLAAYDFTQQEKELDFDADMLHYAPYFVYQHRHGEQADLDEAYPPRRESAGTALPEPESLDLEALRRRFPQLWPKRRAMIEPRESVTP